MVEQSRKKLYWKWEQIALELKFQLCTNCFNSSQSSMDFGRSSWSYQASTSLSFSLAECRLSSTDFDLLRVCLLVQSNLMCFDRSWYFYYRLQTLRLNLLWLLAEVHAIFCSLASCDCLVWFVLPYINKSRSLICRSFNVSCSADQSFYSLSFSLLPARVSFYQKMVEAYELRAMKYQLNIIWEQFVSHHTPTLEYLVVQG